MIKVGLATTNDPANLDNKNIIAFTELAQKNGCEVVMSLKRQRRLPTDLKIVI